MSIIYFPEDNSDFENVESYSAILPVLSESKPFGDFCSEEYLEFAKEDLKENNNRGFLNSLSNSKHCFHYHTERILYRIGLLSASESAKLNFPQKTQLLNELNIISGALLRLYNQERNSIEHDYTLATKEIAECAIELCELYLLATAPYLKSMPSFIRFLEKDSNEDKLVQLLPGTNTLKFYKILGTTLSETEGRRMFSTPIIKPFTEEFKEGIELEDINHIELKINTKDEWLKFIKMFTHTTRSNAFPSYPSEASVTFATQIPLSVAIVAFNEIRRQHQ